MVDNSSGFALANSLADAVARAGRGVVAVHARPRTPSSGIHWREGVIVTADHTLRRREEITITLPDGRSVPATIAGRDPGTDIAVLRIESAGSAVAELGDDASLRTGNLVLALGRSEAGQDGPTAGLGLISAVGGPWRTWRGGPIDRFLRLDLSIFLGFSGGPLVDLQGRVVGLNTTGLWRNTGIAIPSSTVERVATELLAKGHIPRGYVGLGMQPVRLSEPLRRNLGLQAETGLMVITVAPGGPADKGGALMGDILIKLGDHNTADISDVQAALGPEAAGKPMQASVIRAGALAELSIQVVERAAAEE